MKTRFLLLLAVTLSACAAQQPEVTLTPSSQASFSAASSALPADWLTHSDAQFGLSFSYPPVWGEWSAPESPAEPASDALAERSFAALAKAVRYPHTGKADVNAYFRRYDNGNYRYEELSDYEGNITKRDLLEEKATFLKTTTHTIDGVPATVRDFYDVPSAYVVREVRFYTAKYRVRIAAIYDVGDTLVAQQTANEGSLNETAQRLLGADLADPINRLGTMFPQELREMTAFYRDIDKILESMTVAK